ncbi:MAG TPA: DUF3658 domain-containing protein [Gallionellaceae bacterium]
MGSLETINGRLLLALETLDKAAKEIGDLPVKPVDEYVAGIREAGKSIAHIQREINSLQPELEMSTPEEHAPRSLTELPLEQWELVAQLTDSEVQEIDNLLLSYAKHSWRKGAMLVALAMVSQEPHLSNVPEMYYSERIKKLVQSGRLESKGELHSMRDSEVRLPVSKAV